MKAWNKKNRPKGYTKPKWKTIAGKRKVIRTYWLTSRNMKFKIKIKINGIMFSCCEPNSIILVRNVRREKYVEM